MSNLFSTEEIGQLDFKAVPEHVAIIMDGNRRWARQNKLNLLSGHKKGADNLFRIVAAAIELKVKVLTVYAFSTENWDRSKKEVGSLWKLFEEYLTKNETKFQKKEVAIKIIGDISKCPVSLQQKIQKTVSATENNQKITLVLAINYGGRDEILRSFKKMLQDYDQKKISQHEITEQMFASYLDTAKFKDPDLLIRTSGEFRLSNFLLWQLSYSEFYLTDSFWPDFSPKEFLKALLEFQTRQRRFGGK